MCEKLNYHGKSGSWFYPEGGQSVCWLIRVVLVVVCSMNVEISITRHAFAECPKGKMVVFQFEVKKMYLLSHFFF